MAVSELDCGQRCGRERPACCTAQLDGGGQQLTGPTCGVEPVIAGTMDDPDVIRQLREDATALD